MTISLGPELLILSAYFGANQKICWRDRQLKPGADRHAGEIGWPELNGFEVAERKSHHSSSQRRS